VRSVSPAKETLSRSSRTPYRAPVRCVTKPAQPYLVLEYVEDFRSTPARTRIGSETEGADCRVSEFSGTVPARRHGVEPPPGESGHFRVPAVRPRQHPADGAVQQPGQDRVARGLDRSEPSEIAHDSYWSRREVSVGPGNDGGPTSSIASRSGPSIIIVSKVPRRPLAASTVKSSRERAFAMSALNAM